MAATLDHVGPRWLHPGEPLSGDKRARGKTSRPRGTRSPEGETTLRLLLACSLPSPALTPGVAPCQSRWKLVLGRRARNYCRFQSRSPRLHPRAGERKRERERSEGGEGACCGVQGVKGDEESEKEERRMRELFRDVRRCARIVRFRVRPL